jgi:hypothetical protein
MAWDKALNRAASALVKENGAVQSEAIPAADLNPHEAKRETRRSRRVYISMPVLVKFQRGGQSYEEETITEAVNAQGCLLRLNIAPERGQTISVTNLKSTEAADCRVAYVGKSEGGRMQAGVEFMRPAEYFWHIAFPPDDWNAADRKLPVMGRVVAEKLPGRA